jgi:putative transcriptional regulator
VLSLVLLAALTTRPSSLIDDEGTRANALAGLAGELSAMRLFRGARGDPHHPLARHRRGAGPLRPCSSGAASSAGQRRALGVTRKTVNTVENGVFVPSALLALKLARALGVPVEQLFWLEAERSTWRMRSPWASFMSAQVHAPAGEEHAEHADLAADAVGALVLGSALVRIDR